MATHQFCGSLTNDSQLGVREDDLVLSQSQVMKPPEPSQVMPIIKNHLGHVKSQTHLSHC